MPTGAADKPSPTTDGFPLPLTSMERFHLAAHQPLDPNQTFCRLRLEGTVDRDRLQASLTRAVDRHPMFTALLDRSGRRWVWRQTTERPRIQWQRPGEPLPPSDLSRNPGPVVVAESRSDATELLVREHHARCDGVGGIQLIADWMKIYDNLNHGLPAQQGLRNLDAGRLKHRNDLRLLERRYLSQLWKQPIGLFGAAKFIFRRVTPVLPIHSGDPDEPHAGAPIIVGRWLDETLSKQLKQNAVAQQVSLNALVLAELYRYLEQCRSRTVAKADPVWLRILLPMNVRDISDRRMPAANRTAIVQIDRWSNQVEDTRTLAANLNREIEIIRSWHLHKMFLLAIRGMASVPGWLTRSAQSNKCRGAAIFTNLSDPFRGPAFRVNEFGIDLGEVRLTSFDFVGPVRQGAPLYVCLQKLAERLRISIHVDRRTMSSEQAQQWLDGWVDQLRQASTPS